MPLGEISTPQTENLSLERIQIQLGITGSLIIFSGMDKIQIPVIIGIEEAPFPIAELRESLIPIHRAGFFQVMKMFSYGMKAEELPGKLVLSNE
jgi:hypothetical protein